MGRSSFDSAGRSHGPHAPDLHEAFTPRLTVPRGLAELMRNPSPEALQRTSGLASRTMQASLAALLIASIAAYLYVGRGEPAPERPNAPEIVPQTGPDFLSVRSDPPAAVTVSLAGPPEPYENNTPVTGSTGVIQPESGPADAGRARPTSGETSPPDEAGSKQRQPATARPTAHRTQPTQIKPIAPVVQPIGTRKPKIEALLESHCGHLVEEEERHVALEHRVHDGVVMAILLVDPAAQSEALGQCVIAVVGLPVEEGWPTSSPNRSNLVTYTVRRRGA